MTLIVPDKKRQKKDEKKKRKKDDFLGLGFLLTKKSHKYNFHSISSKILAVSY